MPLLSFSVLKEKLLDGSKTQTIRRPRKKYDLKEGDKLYIWWKSRTPQREKLGESRVTKIVTKRIRDLTEWDALRDGFTECRGLSALGHLHSTLYNLHPGIHEGFEDRFVNVITFAPMNCVETVRTEEK